MRNNAYLNDQDILNWYKTPLQMNFTSDGFPILEPCNDLDLPVEFVMLPFNYALNYKGDKSKVFIHFYIQDYMFNRIWNSPQKYIDLLKQYKGIIMPDFSLYTDMPEPLQRFNHYRNLWFARMCQIQDIRVIPSVNWADVNSFDWCFQGLPQNSTLMLSCVGSLKELGTKENFSTGVKQMLIKLNPTHVIIRSTKKCYDEIRSEFFENVSCSFAEYVV